MANLQDLFNELVADSRAETPDTFEEFQSKMEDPGYAEKVNNGLNQLGYDINAYEGLKKKEESMVESAPLSQQESEQPSETTETTQEVGTEPVAQVSNELDPTQADFSAYKIDVKPSKFLSGATPIQTAQPSQVVETLGVEQNVSTPVATPESKHSSILNLAKKAKNKFVNKYTNPIFSQINDATAEFTQDIKATEEGVNEVVDGDPKKKEVKDAATSMYSEYDRLNHKQALRILGDTQALGVKMDGDNYEVVFTNSKMGGKDQGRTYKGVVGDATWNGYVSNNMESTDLYSDENAWEDLKSAVITQDTYSPEIEGAVLQPNFNNNLASHKSKYFPQFKVGQITGTVTVPAESKNEEKNLPFGTDLKRLAEKIKIKVKTSEIINKDKEENKIYNIAQETIPLTEYVMDTEQSFYSSLNNTPETNAIMEANALNFSDVLLPSTKSKEKVMSGIKTFLGNAGYDPNEIDQQSNVIYKEMLRDARYHTAGEYIRHEIESGNKTFKQQDIDRLFQAKQQRVDELRGDDSLATQSDQGFVSNLWDVSLSDYTNHYDAKATVRGRNMDIKNIPGKTSAFTQRMNELNAQIEAEKSNMQLPSEEQLGQSIQTIKDIKQKVSNYDSQLSQIENEINSLIVEQDGKQYLKDESSRQKYEELTNQSNQILSERNALAEQSKGSYKDVEKADAFQKKVSRQVKEYNALVKKVNYYDEDPDLLVMKGLSNTLTSIEDYENEKSAGVKNDLYDFEEYRQKKNEEEIAVKADAEDDSVIEASWKGVTGGLSNALIGTFKTGMYAAEAISGDDNVWDSGDAAEAAVSQLQENVTTWASNPNYEKWGLNWFVNGAAGAIPDLAAVYLTGGGAGFAELAGTRGVIGALGKIAVSPTTVYFTVRSTGDYAERLQKAGYSPGEAFLGGSLIAGVEAGLESMLPSFFATSERIGIKSTFKEVIELSMSKGLSPKEIAKQLTLSYAKTSRNLGKQVFRKTSNESVEEGTQTGFSEVSFAAATDETIEIFNPQTGGMGKTLEAITEAAAIGGAIGNVGASIQGVRTIIRERSENTTLKLTQLQIGRKYGEIIKQVEGLSNEFKGSEVEKEYKKIHEEYTKLASNPNFVKYDDAAKAEVLNMSLTLNELKEAQKNYSSQNIEDVKLNNEINEKEKELATTIGTAQENTDAREEMNKQLEEIGVQSFALNANGEITGMTFDELTTQEEEADIIKKATDIIEKAYKPKPQDNALQEPSTGEVLQRQPQEAGEAGSQRKGVEPVLEGKGATQEGGKEEIIATPQEKKETEAMQTDIDQVQQSTGTVINLNEDGTLTINAPQKGGQSKKEAAIENAKQELTSLGYNVESRITQPQITTEKVKEEEIVRDEAWDENAKESLPKSSFPDRNSFIETIKNGVFGLLTAWNPQRKSLSDEENAKRNEVAKSWLEGRGYSTDGAFGKYGNSELSFFVPNLSREDAVAFAIEFDQESVAAHDGLVYQDGSYHPRVKGKEKFESQGDNYSTMNIAGERLSFGIEYDFNTLLNKDGNKIENSNQENVQASAEEILKQANSTGYNISDTNRTKEVSKSAKTPKQRRVVDQAIKAVKTLKSILPNFEMVVFDNESDFKNYANSIGANPESKGLFTILPEKESGVIAINLESANLRTVAHEMTHAVLFKMFGEKPELYAQFKNKIAELAKGKKLKSVNENGEEIEISIDDIAADLASNEAYDDVERAEEYVSELTAVLSQLKESDPNVKSFLKSVAEYINQFIAKYFGPDLKPIDNTSSPEEIMEFFQTFASKVYYGQEIKYDGETKQADKTSNKAQVEKLFKQKTPVFKSLIDISNYIEGWVNENKLFDDNIENISDKEIVKKFSDHIFKEINAWSNMKGSEYIGFYDQDIPDRLNPELQKFAKERYGRDLTNEEISLYHIVSAFASPSADPEFDSSKGLEVFDKYMTTGELSGYSGEQATEWEMGPKGKYDTGKPKFDEQGNVVYKQIAKAYAVDSLEKFNKVLDHFNNDIAKAVNWVLSKHTYKEISDIVGKPTTGAKAITENEYFDKENGGMGVFGITGVKLGSYILNRIGDYSTVTKDMWYARTLARLAGEPLSEKGKAITSPWALTKSGLRKRKLADEAFAIIAKKLNSTPADVQQKIWDFEKRLYEKLGSIEKSSYASDGFKKKAKELSSSPAIIKSKAQAKAGESLVDKAKLTKDMTEDDQGNYLFYHYSPNKISAIDPKYFGKNTGRTGKDERPGLNISMYYTRPDVLDVSGKYGYVVRIPKDNVYPFNEDPLNLYDAAKATFDKMYPGQTFDPNKQAAFIAQEAAKLGYPMIVVKWGKDLRAETTEKMKGEFYQRPDKDYPSAVEFNPALEMFEANEVLAKKSGPKSKSQAGKDQSQLSKEEISITEQVAGNAKSIMDTTGVSQAEAIKQAAVEITNGDQEAADKYLNQPGVQEVIANKIKQIKAKTERELEAQSPEVTISERKLLTDRVKAEVKAALEGRKEGKKEGVDQAKEQAQKTIDALNKKLEDGKITKQELQDRIKELGYNIRFEAGVARLAGEKTGKSMGKKVGEFVGYFKGLKAGRTEQRGLGAMVSEYIKDVVDNELGKKDVISPATLKSIARRAATISNQKQLDAFVSYLDKVIANKRLAEGLNEIKKLQKQLLNKVGYQYTSNMKMFAKFDMFTADGDLAFDMDTMTEYLDALRDLTSDRVPKIGKMMELFDGMYDTNLQNQPSDIDIADTMDKWQNSIDKLFNNTDINDFEDYKKFKREVGKYMRALNTLLDTGAISEADYESAKNKVIEDSAATDTYATEFQDQIDELKKMLIDGITDKSGYGFMDSIKDWLSNSPNTFTENQKKLIDQLMRATPKNLMTLSLEDLDLLNQVTAQIAEAGFVDEKNLRTLLDRAEIRGNEVGKSLVEQSQKVRNKYSSPKNGYIKMMRDTLGKSVVFWESRLGMKENGAFRKHLIDPIVRAINGWEKDSQRILKNYQKKVESLRSKNILKNAPGIGKLINRTKIEKFKLTTDGTLVPNGTMKVSKDAYDRVMIGVVGHILDNAWNAKQKKKTVNDWLGKQMLSAEERNKMQNEDVNELDIVNDIYNDLKKIFPDGKGGLDHMAVLEAFETDPTSILAPNQLEYYNAARSALQEAGEYINSASGIRNQQHELNPYYMPRQAIGTGKAVLTSTDISYNKNVGAAIRSGASYQRVLQVPTEAIRYNVDRLVMTNVNEGLRDYYLTDAKRYVKEVFSNAQENASSDEVVMLNNLKQLSDTIAPFALEKSKSTFGLSKLMGKFLVDALIGIVRTPVEFTTNLISYAIGNRSLRSLTLPFSPKEKQETDKLLSEFDSSVQFTGLEKKVKLSGKKGIDGYLDRESNFGLINKFLNNITGFMRKGEWMSQFERDFQNNTGEKFNYEKHFVKEKAKYYDDMKKAASDADFRMRRIMKGGNKAEQRQFIEWLPFVKQARISADSTAAPFVGMFSGFINHDADNLIGGLRKAVTRGEIKDGLTQSLGAYSRLALYPVLMVIGKAVAALNLGDDDEKEEAKETLDSLKTAQGWIDLAIFSAKQVGATLVGGKYAAGGKVVGTLLLDAAYTMSEDRRQRRLIENTMRELYFVDPIDFYDLPSEKDDIALQISANLEPIIGMTVDAVADFVKDVRNKGREQVTLYDIYEWTQQTDEGKQWMYMANSIATLGQTLTVMFTPGAIPFIDDYVRWAEDKLSVEKIDPRTEYTLPSGKVIDMQSLILNNDNQLDTDIQGISSREKDRYKEIATEKFKNSIDKVKGIAEDKVRYEKLKYLSEKAKYETAKELGYNYQRWDSFEENFVADEPVWDVEKITSYSLYEDIMKGKQMNYVQNIKDKKIAEDFLFKSLDENPEFKQKYKDGTDGGKKGVRDYYKALYIFDKYKLPAMTKPKKSDFFIEERGQIKAHPNRSKYEEKD